MTSQALKSFEVSINSHKLDLCHGLKREVMAYNSTLSLEEYHYSLYTQARGENSNILA